MTEWERNRGRKGVVGRGRGKRGTEGKLGRGNNKDSGEVIVRCGIAGGKREGISNSNKGGDAGVKGNDGHKLIIDFKAEVKTMRTVTK